MLEGFRLATKKEEKLPLYRHEFELPNNLDFDNFVLYRFLKSHFGKPKSMSWEKRKAIERNPKLFKKRYVLPDDKHQWNYFIRTPHGFLGFSDNRRMYLHLSAYRIVSEEEAKDSTW